ncbi:MAG: TrkA family potassium uptake protein, partial [Anaerolineae bacterium]|nr:TrkA family potassium uptake protein [Anaerolineae bacterium]
FVLIDSDEGIEERLLESRIPFVIGDATREETLIEAGIARARGLVTVLTDDADNIMTVLTARMLRPDLSIISRVVRVESEQKLRAVGAHHVINPYQIGGHRIALSLLRPAVNDFLHRIYHFDESPFIDIGQITLHESSRVVGQTIMACDLRSKYQINILAIQQVNGEMIVTPASDYVLHAGETLVIMGPSEQVYQLERERPESI